MALLHLEEFRPVPLDAVDRLTLPVDQEPVAGRDTWKEEGFAETSEEVIPGLF